MNSAAVRTPLVNALNLQFEPNARWCHRCGIPREDGLGGGGIRAKPGPGAPWTGLERWFSEEREKFFSPAGTETGPARATT